MDGKIAVVVVNKDRYLLQLYEEDGKKGKSYRGRIDTPKGQEKAENALESGVKVILPECELLHFLKEKRDDIEGYVYPSDVLENLEKVSDEELCALIHSELTGSGDENFSRKLSSLWNKIKAYLEASELFAKALSAIKGEATITESDVERGEKLAKITRE